MLVHPGGRSVSTEGTTPAPRLSASWQRSRGFGAPEEKVAPVFVGTVDDQSLLFDCGYQVLSQVYETLGNEPVSLMLTDRNGHVLTRFCDDRALASALDRTYLAPGFAFSEREAGTNGLGLALADRTPSLVRGDEHYCLGLRDYTCAAVPVLDPASGELIGSVNLTTWSRRSAGLLLALARTTAGQTTALMRARGGESRPRPQQSGRVVPMSATTSEATTELSPSREWQWALDTVVTALRAGQSVGVAGEQGAGKSALLASALRQVYPRDRILDTRVPAPDDVASWLALWTPELSKSHTSVITSDADTLPAWAATELAGTVATHARRPLTVTTSDATALPDSLARIVDTIVDLPPLRYRREDVLPLAHHFGRQARGREVRFTPEVTRAFHAYHWPGNAAQLRRVVRDAAARQDTVDLRHVAPEVLCGPTRTLSRLETVERDEIVRCLATSAATVTEAAGILGMGRATIYRKITQYGIRLPEQRA